MKATAFAALLAPLALLIALIGMILMKSHTAPVASSTTHASAIFTHSHTAAAKLVMPITNLPAIMVTADIRRTSAARGRLPKQASWCSVYCNEATSHAAFAMPYYSFGAPTSAADKG
ncbi:MAG: hypothetical protein L0H70_00790 [Xanthomonadales bacterium]|nr:hypothetical protein [Xanthomonadales bacterium]